MLFNKQALLSNRLFELLQKLFYQHFQRFFVIYLKFKLNYVSLNQSWLSCLICWRTHPQKILKLVHQTLTEYRSRCYITAATSGQWVNELKLVDRVLQEVLRQDLANNCWVSIPISQFNSCDHGEKTNSTITWSTRFYLAAMDNMKLRNTIYDSCRTYWFLLQITNINMERRSRLKRTLNKNVNTRFNNTMK